MRGTDSGGPVAGRVASVVAPPPCMCCLRSTIDAGSRGRSRTGFAMSMLSEKSEGPPAASCRDALCTWRLPCEDGCPLTVVFGVGADDERIGHRTMTRVAAPTGELKCT